MTADRQTIHEPLCDASNSAPTSLPTTGELAEAILKTVDFFRHHQHPDGEWVAELEGDALLQSETILLMAFLGEEDSELARGCARRLTATLLPDGGWEMFPGAGADVTNSVKGYFALKLTGHDPASEIMTKTRETILRLGGAEKVNSFTRFYLALLGQIPYDQTPAVPPQMMFLPKWFPINIYSMSSWSRTIFVPLSIVSALCPVRRLPPEKGIRELMIQDPKKWPPLTAPGRNVSKNPFSWDFFFRMADKGIWQCRRFGFTPFRKRAIEKAKEWSLDHFRKSDGPGAIYPPIIWAWIALKALDYSDDSPEILRCRSELESLTIRDTDEDSVRVAPCKSPVWDTALTMKSLRLAGITPNDPMIRRSEEWLLRQQTRVNGDWSQNVSSRPGGWAFEYNNPFYPDNDDTAMALMVLSGRFPEGLVNAPSLPIGQNADQDAISLSETSARSTSSTGESRERQIADGEAWLLAMQNRDGGWGAFDRGNTREILCRVPFADHNAMIDPSCPDLTGRVLESFGRRGYRLEGGHPFLDRALTFMKNRQEADGSWFGRWGVNYLYGTWQALTGLAAIGVDKNDETIRAGASWLLMQQQPCGGWGESPESYRDPALKGKGTPTASQTAWAIMGLVAAGLENHPAVRRGIRFLIDRQRPDGRWDEPEFTGTGFPQVFYLKYHYYSVYFPLMALAIYVSKTLGAVTETPERSVVSADTVSCSAETPQRNESDDDSSLTPAAMTIIFPTAIRRIIPKTMATVRTAARNAMPLRLFQGDNWPEEENDRHVILNGTDRVVIPPVSDGASPERRAEEIILPFPTPCPPLTLFIPEEETAESDCPEEMIFRFESYLS